MYAREGKRLQAPPRAHTHTYITVQLTGGNQKGRAGKKKRSCWFLKRNIPVVVLIIISVSVTVTVAVVDFCDLLVAKNCVCAQTVAIYACLRACVRAEGGGDVCKSWLPPLASINERNHPTNTNNYTIYNIIPVSAVGDYTVQ